jgi:hypothetical protein
MEGAATGGAGGGDGVCGCGLSLSFPLKSLINPDFLCFKARGGGPVLLFGAKSSAMEWGRGRGLLMTEGSTLVLEPALAVRDRILPIPVLHGSADALLRDGGSV